eukprot:Protomagalhaensia_sp_Gyna_25__3578@NODE_3213_length_676_cov_4_882261_g2692_i0_p1_GENE_NODE_3213_length_676_cov_4_882261_g2692_i0NODE_3213_length_676_cov_4_882261_g2692_i0_p1_ORF_typecomplete_len207_score20_32_NODE_3213_length_676_cov_4_882261_g2692_i054605
MRREELTYLTQVDEHEYFVRAAKKKFENRDAKLSRVLECLHFPHKRFPFRMALETQCCLLVLRKSLHHESASETSPSTCHPLIAAICADALSRSAETQNWFPFLVTQLRGTKPGSVSRTGVEASVWKLIKSRLKSGHPSSSAHQTIRHSTQHVLKTLAESPEFCGLGAVNARAAGALKEFFFC